MEKSTPTLPKRPITRKRKFEVEDEVQFHFVVQDLRGRIIEYRGPIGQKGRHIYRVRVTMDSSHTGEGSEMEIELPEDDLTKV